MNVNFNNSHKCKLSVSKCPAARMKVTTRPRRIPAYNTFGPFPDETITITLDRILYFLGGRRIQKFFNTESTSTATESSESSMSMVTCKMCSKHQCPRQSPHGSVYSFKTAHNISYCDVPKFRSKCTTLGPLISRSQKSTPRVCIKDEVYGDGSCLRKSVRTLKRSFSLCSLACRRLKEKLLLGTESYMPPQWLWTKLQDYGNGCRVYEVFTNSSTSSHPTQFESDKAPRIIFVILPTGIIMPFETIVRH
ncbi:uncharacterized protein [Musca autumnalis]|uniref:uncharacterized protein n=1 Tax=Musca autumnalis TaxID=221902 RepID=UPI003CEA0183